jgi:hypothetical protein
VDFTSREFTAAEFARRADVHWERDLDGLTALVATGSLSSVVSRSSP